MKNWIKALGAAVVVLVAAAYAPSNNIVATVNNNAELKNLRVANYLSVRRAGFTTANDGGSGDYVGSNSACTLNAGLGDNGAQVKPNAGTGCWLLDTHGLPVNPETWGAVFDGSTDIYAATVAALATLAPGSSMQFPNNKFGFASATLVLPAGVGLDCGQHFTDNPGNQNTTTPWGNSKAFLSNATIAITTQPNTGGQSVRNCNVIRSGLSWPQNDSANYTNVAIMQDATSYGLQVEDTFILGFDTCLNMNSARAAAHRVHGDCNNGLINASSGDVSRFTDIHWWPYGTIAVFAAIYNPSGTQSCSSIYRSGTGYKMGNSGSTTTTAPILDQTFATGFKTNYDLSYSVNGQYGTIWSDFQSNCTGGTPTDTVGILSDSPNFDTNYIADAYVFGSYKGLLVGGGLVPDANSITFGSLRMALIGGDCITQNSPSYIAAANININQVGSGKACGGSFLNINTTGGVISLNKGIVEKVNASPPITIASPIGTNNLRIGKDIFWADLADGVFKFDQAKMLTLQLSAADPLNIPNDNNTTISVAGASTTINTIGGSCDPDRPGITLIFATTQTIGTAGNIILNGSANFAAGVNNVLELRCAGANLSSKWYEVSRMVP